MCSDSIGDEYRVETNWIRIDWSELIWSEWTKKKRLVVMRFFFTISGGKIQSQVAWRYVVILVFPIILQLMYKMLILLLFYMFYVDAVSFFSHWMNDVAVAICNFVLIFVEMMVILFTVFFGFVFLFLYLFSFFGAFVCMCLSGWMIWAVNATQPLHRQLQTTE